MALFAARICYRCPKTSHTPYLFDPLAPTDLSGMYNCHCFNSLRDPGELPTSSAAPRRRIHRGCSARSGVRFRASLYTDSTH